MEEKGKCYSMVDQGQRNRFDDYKTPYGCTISYVDIIYPTLINKKILEPCAGSGAITKVLLDKDNNLSITEKDILVGDNFYEESGKYDVIITNPPYKNTSDFIEKCYEVAPVSYLLLPITHLQGQKRYNTHTYRHLKSIHILTRMPFFKKDVREDGKFQTGMQAVGWYKFDTSYNGLPYIDWLNVQPFVLPKKEM